MGQPLARISAGIMPARAELAAAADIGADAGAAALKPHLAERRAVIGKGRNAEAAVAGHIDRRVARFPRRPDQYIGNAFAIDRYGFMASDYEAVRRECQRLLLQYRGAPPSRSARMRKQRRQRVLQIDTQIAVAFAFVLIETV